MDRPASSDDLPEVPRQDLSEDQRESLPDALARSLAEPSAWPDATGPVQWIQTHISHVFLVDDRVYKLRKSVSLAFLDFGERAARNADCLREVALNRRLSPSVYLGIAPAIQSESGTRVGPIGERIEHPDREHFVVMRRLPEGCDAQSMLERGELRPEHLEAVAERLRDFHGTHGLGRPAPWSEAGWLERIAAPTLASVEAIGDSGRIPPARVAAVDQALREALEQLGPALEERRLEGRAVDGHGDLHLDHIWFEDEREPCLIDCLEFDEDLRRIDVASEVAFLAMDLRYRGRADLAEYFLSFYASRSDDYGLYRVVDYFSAYRALVRAKVAALAAQQASVPAPQREAAGDSLERHLALAESLLCDRDEAELILLCGTVGCGKSSVARELARAGRGVPIASDRVRKARAGIPAEQHADAAPDEGLYRPEERERVYEALFARAALVLASGRCAILDASFTERAQRARARDWAAQRGVRVRLIEVRCDPKICLERLEERARAGKDPSDAGPEFLSTSLARYEPPEEWPAEAYDCVRTDGPDWAEQLR